jgi:3',5'-cyclic AMP phosphodiesterase CpdA
MKSEGVEHGRVTRRRFLGVSLAAAGGAIALRPSWGGAIEDEKEVARSGGSRSGGNPARWAFLSDTHIAADPEDRYRGFSPYRNLQKVFAEIQEDLPEGLVITGDIARLTGQKADYENFKRLLFNTLSQRPVYLALGNHDQRHNFLGSFESLAGQRQAIKDRHVLTVDAGVARFILLDSLLLTNEAPGFLGKDQRAWLQHHLQTCDDKPVILFLHHPLRDDDGDLLDAPRLFEILRPFSKVKALVYGHSHEYAFSEHEGIHLVNVPAVGYNFADNEPVGWVEVRLTGAGGEFILHAIGGDRKLDGAGQRLRWR